MVVCAQAAHRYGRESRAAGQYLLNAAVSTTAQYPRAVKRIVQETLRFMPSVPRAITRGIKGDDCPSKRDYRLQ